MSEMQMSTNARPIATHGLPPGSQLDQCLELSTMRTPAEEFSSVRRFSALVRQNAGEALLLHS